MTDMVERVARAAYEANNGPISDGQWMLDEKPWILIANAAVKAMREPTDEMIASVKSEMEAPSVVWASYISAALARKGGTAK